MQLQSTSEYYIILQSVVASQSKYEFLRKTLSKTIERKIVIRIQRLAVLQN